MATSKLEQKSLNVEFDTTELNDKQIRLVKSICSMLNHVLTTDDECDYFDGSADLMKMVAGAVKQANFTTEAHSNNSIPYAEQALEFCMDMVADQMHGDGIIRHDN
jgi:hypothetical protein